MFEIIFYKDENGCEPVKDYIMGLKENLQNKDSRIKIHKITEYMKILKQFGTRAGEPYVKHIEGSLWELRPTTERIFFFYWVNDTFVLLHHFSKKTQKTPKKEIKKAMSNLEDFLKRSDLK